MYMKFSLMITVNILTAVVVYGTILPSAEIKKLNESELVKFNTRDNARSFGLNVDVYYPKCMTLENGGFQPHTVAKMSYEWNDFEIYVQMVLSVFPADKQAIDNLKASIEDVPKAEDVASLMPTGAALIDCGVVNIRDVKVLWYEFSHTTFRMGESIRGLLRMYMIPADSGYVMNYQFSVGCATNRDPTSDFRALDPLFRKCAVALTLCDYSQFQNIGAGYKVQNTSPVTVLGVKLGEKYSCDHRFALGEDSYMAEWTPSKSFMKFSRYRVHLSSPNYVAYAVEADAYMMDSDEARKYVSQVKKVVEDKYSCKMSDVGDGLRWQSYFGGKYIDANGKEHDRFLVELRMENFPKAKSRVLFFAKDLEIEYRELNRTAIDAL